MPEYYGQDVDYEFLALDVLCSSPWPTVERNLVEVLRRHFAKGNSELSVVEEGAESRDKRGRKAVESNETRAREREEGKGGKSVLVFEEFPAGRELGKAGIWMGRRERGGELGYARTRMYGEVRHVGGGRWSCYARPYDERLRAKLAWRHSRHRGKYAFHYMQRTNYYARTLALEIWCREYLSYFPTKHPQPVLQHFLCWMSASEPRHFESANAPRPTDTSFSPARLESSA